LQHKFIKYFAIEDMRILLVDNYDSFTFNLAQLVEECGCTELDILKNDKINLKKAIRYDGFLFSPGPGLPKDSPVMKHLIEEYGSSKSILGICLGHQAIGETFGAKLKNLKKVFHGVSKKINITESNYLFKGLPATFDAGLYHSWIVSKERFPSCLKITAMSGDGYIMGISHIKYDIHGVQFHPESIMTKTGKTIINNWLKGE